MRLNKEYIFDGTLDIQKLFLITNVNNRVNKEVKNVPANLAIAEKYLNSESEPNIEISDNCKKPYLCGFWKYCSKHIPNPSVFDLYRMDFNKKVEYYKRGIVSYPDLLNCSEITKAKQIRQIEYALKDKGTYIEKENIQVFLSILHYPLYFLDFETIQPVIPKYIGTKPYAQIPFQYSLHYIEKEGGQLRHKEFLAESGSDPRKSIAEQLCADIPIDACVIAYNKSFECSQIEELASVFPDLRNHLLIIRDNIVDLLEPFQNGYYYNKEMGGSFSIKSVLPAIFPNDPSLNYHNLEGVHNGRGGAFSLFPQIQNVGEAKKARENLLKYCELDTYATVKIWEELMKVAK